MSLQPIIPHLGTNKTNASSAAGTQGNQSAHTQAEIKRAAMEFEAIMLGQMTASMRPETDDEEASLTGGQNDLVQQMFGEQLAGALAKGGGIGVGELLMHELNPNKDKANNASPIERAAETTRHLRRVESPATAASTATSAAMVTPIAADTASVTNVASSPNGQPKDIEPLLAVSRPRRFHEILKTASEPEPEYTAVKLTVSPEAENAKPAFTDATPSQPAYRTQTRLDANTDELSQVTRPRRISELFNAEAPARASAVKLPPVSTADIVKLATINAPTSVNRPNSINAPASISAPAGAMSVSSTAKPVYTGQARLDAIIDQASRRHGVDPHLVAAVMHTESGHHQNAVSNKGASGYMQLMPATFRQFAGPGKSIFDPVTNINAGAAYLKFLSDKYHGNVDKVLAGYNAGIGNVERYGGVPPFRETRNFVASVKKNYHDLAASNHTSAPSMLATSDATPKSKHKHSEMKVEATGGTNEALEAFLSQRSQPTAQPVSLSQQAANQTSADSIDLQLPVQGRISSAFGAHRHNRHHQGVDIAAARGTPIEASASGEVVFAGWSQGYGKTVLIKHQEGTYTRYAHADKLMVSRGDTVQMGQQVATVGSTGHSTGPHLHFEILQGNRRVNPLNVVTGNAGSRIEARIGK